jgi:DUF1365 family protein
MRSAIYVGRVVHERLRPERHRLGYRVFSLLLDLSELDMLSARLRLFSHGRYNLYAFRDADHGDRSGRPIEAQVRRLLADGGIDTQNGPIRLLAYPRVLGYVFNPLSVYFCHDPDERLRATLYEVSNTFGQRHSYLIPVPDARKTSVGSRTCEADGETFDQTAVKRLYVSPFNPVEGEYRFRIRPPGGDVSIGILYRDASGPLLRAHFHGKRRDLTDRVLAGLALTHPALTLKVMLGIHLEALKLWGKRVPLRQRPPAARFAATLPTKASHE